MGIGQGVKEVIEIPKRVGELDGTLGGLSVRST